MSQAKCDAVEALPPFPQTKIRRPSSRARRIISIDCPTFSRSMVSIAFSSAALYEKGKAFAINIGQSPCACYHSPFARPEPHAQEDHTSELQSPCNLVCRLLLEKK